MKGEPRRYVFVSQSSPKTPSNVDVGAMIHMINVIHMIHRAVVVLHQGIAQDDSNSRICSPVSATQQAQPMMRWDKPKCMGEVSDPNTVV